VWVWVTKEKKKRKMLHRARVQQHPLWYLQPFLQVQLVAILSPKNLRFELRDPKHAMLIIFINDLNGFWDFYHGTNLGAGTQCRDNCRQEISRPGTF